MKHILHPPPRLTSQQLEQMYLDQVRKILSAPVPQGTLYYHEVGKIKIECFEDKGYWFARRVDGSDRLDRLDEK